MRIIKIEDMVAHNIQKVAPTLAIFYQEDKIVQILKQGEDLAGILLKDRKRLTADHEILLEADRAQAKSELDAIKDKAFQDGLKAGQEMAYQQLSDVIDLAQQTRIDLEAKTKTWMAEAESDMVRLTLVIAEKIVGHELATHPETLIEMIKALLQNISEQRRLTIQVNPDDLALVQKHLPELKKTLGVIKEFTAEANTSVNRGGVMFDMDSGVLDAQVETQVSKLAQTLLDDPR